MEAKKLDIWIVAITIILYGVVVLFSFLPKQDYFESLILLSTLFIALIISYFGGVTASLAISALSVFSYGSFILYRNVVLGFNVDAIDFFWLIIIPAASSIMAVISNNIKKIQETNIHLKEKYNDLVTVDEKTGLENEKVFYNIMQQNMGLSKRYKIPLSLMMVRVQYYDDIIQLVGESEMEHFLKYMGESIIAHTRIEDCAYIFKIGDRYTFALILFSDMDGALVVKKRIKLELGQYKTQSANKTVFVKVDLKVGIAEFNEKTKDVFELKELAEKDMDYDV